MSENYKTTELFTYEQCKLLLGDKEFQNFLDILTTKHPSSIRVNTLRYNPEEYLKRADENGILLEPVPLIEEGFFVKQVPPESSEWWLREHLYGRWYGQGSASMLPPKILLPEKINPVLKVLDATAAPGSKTTQMGALMQNKGLIVANDRKAHRLYALHRNVQIMGLSNTIVTQLDARYLGIRWPQKFDLVLVDGPCSATGTNRSSNRGNKLPFSNRQAQHFNSFQKYQQGILKSSINTLNDNDKSRLLYSTCSVLPIENELVLTPFLENNLIELEPVSIPDWKTHPGLTDWDGVKLPEQLSNAIRIYPQDQNSDAFFIALIKKA